MSADPRTEAVITAARKLVAGRGRHHTEQNYKALAQAIAEFDATSPAVRASPLATRYTLRDLRCLRPAGYALPKDSEYVAAEAFDRVAGAFSQLLSDLGGVLVNTVPAAVEIDGKVARFVPSNAADQLQQLSDGLRAAIMRGFDEEQFARFDAKFGVASIRAAMAKDPVESGIDAAMRAEFEAAKASGVAPCAYPIETAPKDGREVLLLIVTPPGDRYAAMVGEPNGWKGWRVGYWDRCDRGAGWELSHEISGAPTHWAHLPADAATAGKLPGDPPPG
jgi:hypothetical protein